MAKRKGNSFSKKKYKGLKRVGKAPNRKWSYNGKTFGSLAEVHKHYVKMSRANAKSDEPKTDAEEGLTEKE